MFQSIWEDIKREFSYGNMITRLVIVNVAVFIVMSIVRLSLLVVGGSDRAVIDGIFAKLTHFFSMSSDLIHVLTHPWVVFTHMFLHTDLWHVLWNMLFLYWFGRIVGDLIGNQRVLPIYLLGGLSGAVFYVLSALLGGELLSIGPYALGASAAVMALMVTAGATAPNYLIHLLFLGAVRLKYIVGFFVLLDIVTIANIQSNAGGSAAHLGGALMGWLFVAQLREGNDFSQPINRILDRIIAFFQGLKLPINFTSRSKKHRKRPHMAYKNPNAPRPSGSTKRNKRAGSSRDSMRQPNYSHQERVDAILDKIKRSGYDSLSSEEKEFLFNASKK